MLNKPYDNLMNVCKECYYNFHLVHKMIDPDLFGDNAIDCFGKPDYTIKEFLKDNPELHQLAEFYSRTKSKRTVAYTILPITKLFINDDLRGIALEMTASISKMKSAIYTYLAVEESKRIRLLSKRVRSNRGSYSQIDAALNLDTVVKKLENSWIDKSAL